jgi:hypothetical protein
LSATGPVSTHRTRRERRRLGRASVFERSVNRRRLRRACLGGILDVATLGPSGTSSEAAAASLIALAQHHLDVRARVSLYPSFEAASIAVLQGTASVLIVANAYANANAFYMDPKLDLIGAFIADTPPYGVAARVQTPIPLCARVASHPAPVPLLRELLPPGVLVEHIVPVRSTTEAVRAMLDGEADLALTNEHALRDDVEFVSPTRPIQMLWSIFARAGGGRSAARKEAIEVEEGER